MRRLLFPLMLAFLIKPASAEESSNASTTFPIAEEYRAAGVSIASLEAFIAKYPDQPGWCGEAQIAIARIELQQGEDDKSLMSLQRAIEKYGENESPIRSIKISVSDIACADMFRLLSKMGRKMEAQRILSKIKDEDLRKSLTPRLVVDWDNCIRARVTAIAFAPDASVLAAAIWPDGRIALWDLRTATLLGELQGHTRAVFSLSFSPDGSHLASAGGDEQVRVWSVQARTLVRAFDAVPTFNGWVNQVGYSPDGQRLVAGSRYNLDGRWRSETMAWNVGKGARQNTLPGHRFPVFVSDHALLTAATVSAEDRMRHRLPRYRVQISEIDGGPKAPLVLFEAHQPFGALAASPTGTTFAVASYGEIRLSCAQREDRARTVAGNFGNIRRLVFSHDGASLLAVNNQSATWLVDTQSGNVQEVAGYHSGAAFSGNGAVLALGGEAVDIRDPTGQNTHLFLHLILNSGKNRWEWVAYTPEGVFRMSPAAGPFIQWRTGSTIQPFDAYAKSYERPEEVIAKLRRALAEPREPEPNKINQK